MVVDQIPVSGYLERTETMKQNLLSHPHEICLERALLFTESYKQTKGEPPIIRFAKAMDYLLRTMTIKIWDDEIIVGNRCIKYAGTPLFPEIRVDTLDMDCNSYNTRQFQHLHITDEEIHVLKEQIIPYWRDEETTVQKRFEELLDPKVKKVADNLVFIVDTELTNGFGHFLPGHEILLKTGIDGLLHSASQKLRETSGAEPENLEKRTFYESVIIVLNAAKAFIKRFSNLAQEMAQMEANTEREKELMDISEICANISEKPPKTFREALQLIHFNHLICGLEDGGFAISVGRLDQYLISYYLNDKEDGRLTSEEAQFLLESFFIKLTTLWNYVMNKGTIAAEGPPIAENLTIGGVDSEGNDATNELSYLILDAYAHIQTVQPTFSVRINKNTPEAFLRRVGEAINDGASIALFNDGLMIRGLMNRGFTIEDARHYAPIGCVEPQHPYKSFASTNANQLNIVKCLELVLYGRDMVTGMKYGLTDQKEIASYEDLWDNFLDQMRYFIKYMVLTMEALDQAFAELNPQPFFSAAIGDCLERGLDVTRGGAAYDFTGPQLIGLATVSDSLAVIKKMVFEEKRIPLADLVRMLKKDFKGTIQDQKGRVWRELFINKVPKFGNDDDYADQIAVEVARAYCDEIVKYKNYRGGKYNPGIYSTAFHLALGAFTGATADGRKLGTPLSNGVGPTHGMDRHGPTSLLKSVMKLPNELMTNGNSLILAFQPNSVVIDNFIPLLRTFFSSEGGYHLQFNAAGRDILLDAQQHPESHRSLVVRIAGYSVYFTELSKGAQDEIIARTECQF
jgi:pyruvate formate-lyase/glycerol dehydratase family glycyl radical enzyme